MYAGDSGAPDVVALCDQCGRAIRRSRPEEEEGLFFGYGERIVPLHVPGCGDLYEVTHGKSDGEYTLETFLKLFTEGLGLKAPEAGGQT